VSIPINIVLLVVVSHRSKSIDCVVGIDATPEFIRRANERTYHLPNTSFIQGDASALPYEMDSFDVTACRAAFHHFPQPEDVVAEMVRVTRPGGKIVIADIVTAKDNAQADYHNVIEKLCDPTHTRALKISEFQSLMAAQRVKIETLIQGSQQYDLEEWISHGNPPSSIQADIRDMMEKAHDSSVCEYLKVKRVSDRWHFSHDTALMVGKAFKNPKVHVDSGGSL
jgi:ubiquinone/menaquinone biosynthesis C-methylase UbiE